MTSKQSTLWLVLAALIINWLTLLIILITSQFGWQIALLITVTLSLSLAILSLNYHYIKNRKIRVIELLAQEIEQRNDNLFQPLVLDDVPDEIHPLVIALNHLLQREQDRVQQEHAFTSEASHELRTPLAGIRLQAQIAQRTSDSVQREKAIHNIIKAIDRSTRLVEQLLTLSRLTWRRLETDLGPVTLKTLCEKTLADYRQAADERHIILNTAISDTLSPVQAHYDYLETLLKNLLDNSLRYAPDNGEIRITAHPEKGTIILTVEDSGPGIDPSEYDTVIAPFQKAANGQKHGTGLGLAIVNRIAELHNSRLLLKRSELGGLSVSLVLAVAV